MIIRKPDYNPFSSIVRRGSRGYAAGWNDSNAVLVKPASSGDDAGNITDVLAQGRVVQLMDDEYSIRSPILLYSLTGIIGVSESMSILKVADGANIEAVIKTWNYDDLTGTDAWATTAGVPYGFVLKNFSIHGNNGNINEGGEGAIGWGTNQTSGDGTHLFGKGYEVDNLAIYDCYGHGFMTECGPYDTNFYSSFHIERGECFIGTLECGYNGGSGVRYEGPHDSQIHKIISGRNTIADGAYNGAYQSNTFIAGGGGSQIGEIHDYGQGKGIYVGATNININSVYVDFTDPGLVVAGDNCRIGLFHALNCGSHDTRAQYDPADRNWTSIRVTASRCKIGLATIQNTGDAGEGIVNVDIQSGADNFYCGNLDMYGNQSTGVALKINAANVAIPSYRITSYHGDGAQDTQGGCGIEVANAENLILKGKTYRCGTHIRWTEAASAGIIPADVKCDIQYAAKETPIIGRPNPGTHFELVAYNNDDAVIEIKKARNSGVATLVNGTTSIVVSHGLMFTPRLERISIQPVESWGSAGEWRVTTSDAFSFTVTVDANPGADVDFSWRADCLCDSGLGEFGVPINPAYWMQTWNTMNLSTTTTSFPPARPSDTDDVVTVGDKTRAQYDAAGANTYYTWDESGKQIVAGAANSAYSISNGLSEGSNQYTVAGVFQVGANGEAFVFRNDGGNRFGIITGLSAGNTGGTLIAAACGDTFPSNVGTIDMSTAMRGFVATINGDTKKVSVWVDGVLDINDATFTGNLSPGTDFAARTLYFGNTATAGGPTRGITGGIREALIYHRILSAGEITALGEYLTAVAAL